MYICVQQWSLILVSNFCRTLVNRKRFNFRVLSESRFWPFPAATVGVRRKKPSTRHSFLLHVVSFSVREHVLCTFVDVRYAVWASRKHSRACLVFILPLPNFGLICHSRGLYKLAALRHFLCLKLRAVAVAFMWHWKLNGIRITHTELISSSRIHLAQLFKTFPTFHATRSSLPCSQQPDAGQYPESDESRHTLIPHFIRMRHVKWCLPVCM